MAKDGIKHRIVGKGYRRRSGLGSLARKNSDAVSEYSRMDGGQNEELVLISHIEENGESGGIADLAQDVSEQWVALKELSRNERNYRAAFETSPLGLALLGIEGECLAANPAFCRMTGYQENELKSLPLANLFDPDDWTGTMALVKSSAVDASGGERALRMRHRSGECLWVGLTVAPLRGENGGTPHFVLHAQDRTRSREADQRIAELERNLAETTRRLSDVNTELASLAHAVSHDLRAPLRAIDGYSEVVLADYGDALDQEGRRMLGVVCSEAGRMGGLLDDLLNLSRLGRHPMDCLELDLTDIFRARFDCLKRKHDATNTQLRLGPLPSVYGDPTLIRTVVENLLDNAIKFSAARNPAVIEVSGSESPEEAVVMVRDNGIGFDDNGSDKMFRPFHRLHGEDEFAGNGIGLAIVSRLMARHRGRVWAEAASGQSATFSFSLPKGGGPAGTEHGYDHRNTGKN